MPVASGTNEEALLPLAKPLRSFRIRWWLLVLASAVAGGQGGMWVTYGVIAQAVKPLYGWDDGTIALLANWGVLGYLLAAWPTSWLLDNRGPRSACVVGSALTFLGGVARIVRHETDGVGSTLAHVGQILNALAGPVAMSIGPVLSAMWFPPAERNLATAIVATANYGGCALVFWLAAVSVPADAPASITRDRLWYYMLGECAFGGATFFLCVITIPSRPPAAPSTSATVARDPFSRGLRRLARRAPFWMLLLSYSISSGVFQAWGSQLGPIMQGVLAESEAQRHAGMIGCYGALAGMVGGVGLGLCADQWRARRGWRKALLVSACGLACACFTLFALACLPDGQHDAQPEDDQPEDSHARHPLVRQLVPIGGNSTSERLVWMYATSIVGSASVNAAIPLFFEFAVEAAFPVAEGLTTTALTLGMNLPTGAFLLIPTLFPTIGVQWMLWALVGACALATVLVLPLVEPSERLRVDAAMDAANGSIGDRPERLS